MYRTSVNPSPSRSSSATYWGATQRPVTCTSVSFVVSGGGSATAGLGLRPRSPAVPASVSPPKNARRLHRCVCWLRMDTSLPDAGQADTENAGPWTLLPSHEQAQHLTLAVSGGPHGQPHAGHGCPLWPVRSSALFGGGSALVLATSPRSQGAPAESRRPPTAGTVSVPISPPAPPRAAGF